MYGCKTFLELACTLLNLAYSTLFEEVSFLSSVLSLLSLSLSAIHSTSRLVRERAVFLPAVTPSVCPSVRPFVAPTKLCPQGAPDQLSPQLHPLFKPAVACDGCGDVPTPTTCTRLLSPPPPFLSAPPSHWGGSLSFLRTAAAAALPSTDATAAAVPSCVWSVRACVLPVPSARTTSRRCRSWNGRACCGCSPTGTAASPSTAPPAPARPRVGPSWRRPSGSCRPGGWRWFRISGRNAWLCFVFVVVVWPNPSDNWMYPAGFSFRLGEC